MMLKYFSSLLIVLLLYASPAFCGANSGSVGVQVVPVSTGELVALHVIDGLPAAGAGLLPGDLIVEVDGHALRGSDFEEVIRSYLWGEVGTSLSLTWLRPGVSTPFKATLQRVKITDVNVKTIPGVNITTPE